MIDSWSRLATTFAAIAVGALATHAVGCVVVPLLGGCDGRCDDPSPVRSGTFVVTARHGEGFEWLVGADVTVDREARLLAIRYTSDGTTYEVRYTLSE